MSILNKLDQTKRDLAGSISGDKRSKSYFKENIFCSSTTEQYEREVNYLRSLKKKSLDDSQKELCMISNTMTKKVATLLELPELEQQLNNLLPEPNRENLLLKVIDLILAKDGSLEEKYELALRVCLGVLTEGVVTAPLDGLVSAKIDPVDNFPRLVFAGPIRAVGGTNLIYILVVAEYLRKKLGLNTYTPTEAEVERTIAEIKQYIKKYPGQIRPSTQELDFVVRNCSIMVDGVETEIEEVSVHKKLPRIQKSRIRGAISLVFVEGFILRSKKILPILEYFELDNWQPWIKDLIVLSKTYREEGQRSNTQTKFSLTMGRPLLSTHNSLNGLRLKIGRSPTTGLAGSNVTKELIDLVKFINVGTQLVINSPGKATTITGISADLAKPIVLYKDNTIDYYTVGRYDQVEKILDLGQILICTGDFIEFNKELPERDYCVSCWLNDTHNEVDFKDLTEIEHLNIRALYENAKLHPQYALMIDALDFKEYMYLRNRIKKGDYSINPEVIELLKKANVLCKYDGVSFTPKYKAVFEYYLLLDEPINLDLYYEYLYEEKNRSGSNLTKYINHLRRASKKTQVPEKGRASLYARVGRCEAVNISRVKPKPFNALINYDYTVKSDSFWAAIEKAPYKYANFNLRYCHDCKKETYLRNCGTCMKDTSYAFRCDTCESYYNYTLKDLKRHEDHKLKKYYKKKINYEDELKDLQSTGLDLSESIKQLTNDYPLKPATKNPVLSYEPLIKGVLRSKRGLFATKDGTIRTTFCNASTTHFTPRMINTDYCLLKKMGYQLDVNGKELNSQDQILALKYTDCIISYATAQWIFKITKFIDELLIYYYKTDTVYYNFKTVTDLVGILTQMISPHTSNAVLGRVIGFVNNYCVYTHPLSVSCRRRDIDGDIDALYVTADMILNCSKKFIPEQKRGALMSVPLTLTTQYHINQLDKQVLSLELNESYYDGKLINTRAYMPADLKNICVRYKNYLDHQLEPKEIKYNVKSFSFDVGNYHNWYKDSTDTAQKLERFIDLTEKLSFIDKKEVYMGLIEGHILPDIVGNLNAFYRQEYKCSFCGLKYPKLPLKLNCTKCNVGLLKPTVYPGMVLKFYNILKFFEKLQYLPKYLTQKITVLDLVLESFLKERGENPLLKLLSGNS